MVWILLFVGLSAAQRVVNSADFIAIPWTAPKASVSETSSTSVIASDTGATAWYFTAPSSFIAGALVYGGAISFTLTPVSAVDFGLPPMPSWDVILRCAKTQLGLWGVLTPTDRLRYVVPFHSGAPWRRTDTNATATRNDIAACLRDASGLQIRGGYFL
jgi:hypothetical protein